MRLALALVTAITAGCYVHQSRPSRGLGLTHEMGFFASTTHVWKDGREIYSGVWQLGIAGAVEDAVAGVPDAERAASTARTLSVAGIPTGVLGLGGLIGGAFLMASGQESATVNGVTMTRVTDEGRRNAGIGVAIGGVVAVTAAGLLNVMSRQYVGEAVTLYNNARLVGRARRLVVAPTVVTDGNATAPGIAAEIRF